MEARHLPHPLNRPLGLDKRRENGRDADDSDRKGVVIVVVDRPEEDGGDLKHIEWVQNLAISIRLGSLRDSTHLIYQQSADSL